MTTNALTSSFTTAPCHHGCSSRLAFSCRFSSNTAKFCSRRCCRGRIPLFSRRVLRVFCQAGVSRGSHLPMFVDKFFEAGRSFDYWCENTSWVWHDRNFTSCCLSKTFLHCKVLGSSGHPIRYTELKIVDPDTNETLPPGTKGIIKVRGSQVIKDPL